MQKLITQLVGASTLLLCLACVDTETIYERLADSCVSQVDQQVLPRLHRELDTLAHRHCGARKLKRP